MTKKNNTSPFPGIHLITLPLKGSALKHINAYLLPGKNGHLLIDTGWKTEDTYEALKRQFDDLGFDMADVSDIIITHAHIDHFGLIRKLKKISKATVHMHDLEQEMLALRYHNPEDFAQQANELILKGGVPERFMPLTHEIAARFIQLASVCEPDVTFKGGEIFRHEDFEFEILLTPGHSPGHICMYEPNRKLIFCGDHVLPGITPNIGIYPQSGDNPLGLYLESLGRVKNIQVDLALPAHGQPFTNFSERAEQIIKHHSLRNDELTTALKKTGRFKTAFEMVADVTWHFKGAPVAWKKLPVFDQRLAISEVMSHLAALAHDGILKERNQGGILSYFLS